MFNPEGPGNKRYMYLSAQGVYAIELGQTCEVARVSLNNLERN